MSNIDLPVCSYCKTVIGFSTLYFGIRSTGSAVGKTFCETDYNTYGAAFLKEQLDSSGSVKVLKDLTIEDPNSA